MSAITIIRSRKPAVLCKRFEAIGGVLRKTAVAHVTEGTCHTLPVESATDMIQALNEVTASRDLCIVPGVWLGASDEPFDLVTEAKLGEMLGNEVKGGVQVIDGRRVAARVKRGIEPSAWLLIDADDPPGIPDDWKAMSLAERLAFLEPLIPGISRCERIELRSSSARVVNGDGTPKPASHAWLRVSDPGRIETLRARVQIEMVNRGLSFPSPRYSRAEPGKVIGHEHRTVVDLSVWITGRIVFNAMPQLGVGMEAYTVTDPGITVVNAGAGALDIDWAVRPDAEALERYREATGVQVLISERGANISTTCTGELTLDTEIEARGVTKTLRDWAAGLRPGERLRCEAPFRASSSEAAFIKVPANGGMPFVHDVGTGTTYRIEEPEIEAGDPRPDPPPEPSTVATRTRQRKESEDIAAGFAPPMVAEHLTLEQMLEEMVYVADGSRVSRRGCPWYSLPLSEFKKLTSASVTAVGKRLIPTADAWVADAMRRTVHTVTFRPGAPEFTQNTEGAAALNTWRPYVRPSSSASVEPFLDHVTYLVPIQEERERFLKWLAHIEQQPGVLPHTHYLMVTPQTGIGRNWLAGLLGRVWHGASRLGFDLAGVLDRGFNGPLMGRLFVVVDELKIMDATGWGGRAKAESLKEMLTVEHRTINPKYGRQHHEFNVARFLMLSQHFDAIPLEHTDRRIIVIANPTERRTPEYYTRLYSLLDDVQFVNAVANWLAARDIAGYNPSEPAPLSASKRRAINDCKTDVEHALIALRDGGGAPVMRSTDIQEYLIDCGARVSGPRALAAAYRSTGLVPCTSIVNIHGKRHRVVALRDADRLRDATADVLRDLLDP